MKTSLKEIPTRSNPWCRKAAVVVLCVAGLSLLTQNTPVRADLASNTLKARGIARPGATAYGKTLTEWLTIYWAWAFAGSDPAQNQVGSVQLLALPAGEYVSGSFTPGDPGLLRGSLEITLRPGTAFVLPLYAWSVERYQGYPAVPDDLPIDTEVALGSGHPTLTIDGNVVVTDDNKAGFFVPNTVFDPIVVYPAPTSYGSVAAVAFQGVGVIVNPLSPGVHVIHLYEPLILQPGDYPGLPDGLGFIYDNTWTITVK